MGITSREPGTVRGTARRPHFSHTFISITVQLWTHVFWVILVYFNIRNTLLKSGTCLLGHPVYSNTEIIPCNHCCSGKSNKYYIFKVCVYSLRFPGCMVHVPYCYLWPVQLYYIFPSYLINFQRKLLNTKCLF